MDVDGSPPSTPPERFVPFEHASNSNAKGTLSPSQQKYLTSRGAPRDPDRWKEKFRQQLWDRIHSTRLADAMARRKASTVAGGSALREADDLSAVRKREFFDAQLNEFLRQEQLEFDGLGEEEYIDFMNFVEEALQSGLRHAEQQILLEEADLERMDADYLEDTVHRHLEQNILACPVCKKHPLHQHDRVFFCQCGLRIDTQSDGITLNHVAATLRESLAEHEAVCAAQPLFSVRNSGMISTLIMSCHSCGYMNVII